MLNKEEIVYNCESLVSTWIDGKDGIKNLTIELSDGDDVVYYPIELVDCGKKIGDLLFNNNGKYKLLQLSGEIGDKREIIGSIDIIN